MSLLAKREENGARGESLTQSVLLSRFWVLKRSADVDGADFLVQHQYNTLEEVRHKAHGIEILGIIQSKYFENSNRVEIQKSYVLNNGVPRKEFFCCLHSHDESGEPEHYFFSAEDIVKEFTQSACKKYYWFALSSTRRYENYKNKKQKFILDKIELGMYQAEADASKSYRSNKLSVYARPTMHFQDAPDFKYRLTIVDDVRVVIAYDLRTTSRRLLEPRRDLFENQGDYYWGDDETGCHFLAVSLLAHHLDGESPTDKSVWKLRRILQSLEENSTYEVTSETLQEIINDHMFELNRLHELEDLYPLRYGDMGTEYFEIISLLGSDLTIRCKNGIESVLDINGSDYMKMTVDAARIFRKGIEASSESTKKMIAVELQVQRDAETLKVIKILNAFDVHFVD